MDLVEVKCSNCGANLKVNSKDNQITCQYCGNSFVINKSKNKETNINEDILLTRLLNSANAHLNLEDYLSLKKDAIKLYENFPHYPYTYYYLIITDMHDLIMKINDKNAILQCNYLLHEIKENFNNLDKLAINDEIDTNDIRKEYENLLTINEQSITKVKNKNACKTFFLICLIAVIFIISYYLIINSAFWLIILIPVLIKLIPSIIKSFPKKQNYFNNLN